MKKIILLLVVSQVFVQSCKQKEKENVKDTTVVTEPINPPVQVRDSTLVTDSSWGLINQSADFSRLKEIYGPSNVKDDRICGAECIDSVDVTIIYPSTINEMTIYWEDSASYHKKITRIESYVGGAPYHTASGLKIGSSLNDLIKVNGKKINFSGFGWDYGGYVQSYNGGSLEKSNVSFRLDAAENSSNKLFGDTELNSDMPFVKKYAGKITIQTIALSFSRD